MGRELAGSSGRDVRHDSGAGQTAARGRGCAGKRKKEGADGAVVEAASGGGSYKLWASIVFGNPRSAKGRKGDSQPSLIRSSPRWGRWWVVVATGGRKRSRGAGVRAWAMTRASGPRRVRTSWAAESPVGRPAVRAPAAAFDLRARRVSAGAARRVQRSLQRASVPPLPSRPFRFPHPRPSARGPPRV